MDYLEQRIKNLADAFVKMCRRDARKTELLDNNVTDTKAVSVASKKIQSDVEYIAMMSDIDLD